MDENGNEMDSLDEKPLDENWAHRSVQSFAETGDESEEIPLKPQLRRA